MKTRSQSVMESYAHPKYIMTRSKSHTLHKSAASTSSIRVQNDVIYPSRYSERLRRRNNMYDVDIDFDEASRAWLKNKTPVGNGCYIYTKNT